MRSEGHSKAAATKKKFLWNQASNMLLPVEVLQVSFVLFHS